MVNCLLVKATHDSATILKTIREKLRLTQAEFAEELGITRERYKNYEYSLAKAPGDILQKARVIEHTLSIPLREPGFLVTFPPQPMRYAGGIPAGDWADPFEAESFEDVDPYLWHAKRWCATIEGFSCYPALQPGDFTIWHEDENPRVGLLVAAKRTEDNAATVKVLEYDDAERRSILKAVNPDYDGQLECDGWSAIARLVCVIRRSEGLERRWYLPEGLRPKHLA